MFFKFSANSFWSMLWRNEELAIFAFGHNDYRISLTVKLLYLQPGYIGHAESRILSAQKNIVGYFFEHHLALIRTQAGGHFLHLTIGTFKIRTFLWFTFINHTSGGGTVGAQNTSFLPKRRHARKIAAQGASAALVVNVWILLIIGHSTCHEIIQPSLSLAKVQVCEPSATELNNPLPSL